MTLESQNKHLSTILYHELELKWNREKKNSLNKSLLENLNILHVSNLHIIPITTAVKSRNFRRKKNPCERIEFS